MLRAHSTAAALAALLLAEAAAGSAVGVGSGRRVDVGAATVASGDPCHATSHGSLRRDTTGADPGGGERPSGDHVRVEDALSGCGSLSLATRSGRLALALLKKKLKKKIKAARKRAGLPAARVARIPVIHFDPQKASPQTHPAIPQLRTVLLLV